MKRDMDLVRQILLGVESASDIVREPSDIGLQCSAKEFYGHVKILGQADYLDVMDLSSPMLEVFYIKSLTWQGHELLDNIRNETVWNKTKVTIGEHAGTVSVSIMQELAKVAMRTLMGLPTT